MYLGKIIFSKLRPKTILIYIFAILGFLSINYNARCESDEFDNSFLEPLKDRSELIRSIKADWYFIINMPGAPKMVQKAKYLFRHPDKLRIRVYEPAELDMVSEKGRFKMVDGTGMDYLNSSHIKSNSVLDLTFSDHSQYYFLKKYQFKLKQRNENESLYEGYEKDEFGKYVRMLELFFDEERKVANRYVMYGNEVMHQTEVVFGYDDINGILFPARVVSRVKLSYGEVVSKIVLKNIFINIRIDDEEFVIK